MVRVQSTVVKAFGGGGAQRKREIRDERNEGLGLVA